MILYDMTPVFAAMGTTFTSPMENPATLTSVANLSIVLAHEGKYEEADKLCRETLETRRRGLGPEHPDTNESIYYLARIDALRVRRDEAISLLGESVNHRESPQDSLEILRDPDLKSSHGDPRFDALMAQAKERASAAPKQN